MERSKKSKASILVIEDDQPILFGLQDFFVFNGFSVAGVEDGGEGLKRALTENHDLIVLDVMLPTMDGFSVLREIRKKNPRQPVIILTAKGSEDDVVTGFKAGADDYVPKPFSLRELMVRVEAVLRRAGKSLGDEQVNFADVAFDGKSLIASGRARDGGTDQAGNGHRGLSGPQPGADSLQKGASLREVWNYADPDVETRTVDIHMLKLRKKMAGLLGGKTVYRHHSRRGISPRAGNMKRLKILILVFCAALAVPLGYFVFRTHLGPSAGGSGRTQVFCRNPFPGNGTGTGRSGDRRGRPGH